MSVRWASGAMIAVLAGSVAADECSDYRAAFVLREAAIYVFRDIVDKVAPKFEGAELRAAEDAMGKASRDLHRAGDAVRRTIDDHSAAALAIDAIYAARAATAEAMQHVVDWTRATAKEAPWYLKMTDASGALSAAYYEALHFACRESAP